MMYYEYSQLKDMIRDLEYIIASKCRNKQYIDKHTGNAGKQYRYPVKYKKNGKTYVCRGKTIINEDTAEQEIESMRYEFGSNCLFIGDAIAEILDYLEDRYELDFYALERDYEMLQDE